MQKPHSRYYETTILSNDPERLEQFEHSILTSFKAEPVLVNHFFAETHHKEPFKVVIRVWGDMPYIKRKLEDSKRVSKLWSYKLTLRRFKVDISFSDLFNSPIENN